jgi:hypothetical protein
MAAVLVAACSSEVSEPATAEAVGGDESAPVAFAVEAACGQCQFDLAGEGCDLAVRIDGQAYFVDGTSIDDHGDAHAEIGFCNAVRSARVTGQVEDDRFAVTAFELLPSDG